MGENNNNNDDVTRTEAYIDEQLANAREMNLKREIMKELKSSIQTTVSNELEFQKITNNNSYEFGHSGRPEQNELIFHMKKEIEFLRNQIETRDELINSLLKKNSYKITNNTQKDTHKDISLQPKKTLSLIHI